MKVIFLDFDGVINNWEYFEGIDYNVKYLLEIINSTGAKVVATSSKKYQFQRNLFFSLFHPYCYFCIAMYFGNQVCFVACTAESA